MRPIILAIDFDNTIVKVKDFPNIFRIRKGAAKYINKLYDQNYHIIIWTCRTDSDHCYDNSDAKRFLNKKGIRYHSMNDNHYALKNHFQNNSRKISADIYIDDKGLWPFGIPSWRILYWLIKWKSKFLKHPVLYYCNEWDL